MSDSLSGLRTFASELKRRRVFRVAAAYVVVAFALLQAADIILPALGLPPWTMTLVVVLAFLGFPVTVVLAWAFDVTPEGVVRTGDAEAAAGGRRAGRASPARWALAGLVLLAVTSGGWLGWRRLVAAPESNLDGRVVAVLPFRVAGAEPGLAYLREGMLDLLAAKLTGEAGPRAVDPRTLTSAWRRVAREGTGDLSREEALALARGLGAGRLVLGEVVSLPGRVVLTASLSNVGSGRADAPVSVEGPVDSLPALVDRLVAGLLSIGAGEGERLASLTTTSLPALRLYLEGQAAFRAARYDEALPRFQRAVEIDSTFALAAFMVSRAAGYLPAVPGEIGRQAFALAWRHRERLSERDRIYLTAVAGPNYPGFSSAAERLAAREAFLRERPDSPEARFEWGDDLFHYGVHLDIPDTTVLRRSVEAFHRTLMLDSLYLPAYDHLAVAAMLRGDSAALRRHGEQYLAREPTGLLAEAFRSALAGWSRGRAALPEIIARTDSAGGAVMLYTLNALSLHPQTVALAHTLADHLASRTDDPEVMRELGGALYPIALSRGRPAAASRYLAGLRGGRAESLTDLASRVRDGMYWDGDTDATARAAESLAAQLERLPAASRPADAICALGQWRLARGETATVAPLVTQLRTIGGAGTTGAEVSALRCAVLLGAWRAAATGAADASTRIARLDSLQATGPVGGRITHEANLVLARLLEARGDLRGALRVLGRLPGFGASAPDRVAFLRERGRVAALLGDTAAAAEAYRFYLAIRADPEPPLRPEVERARAELARLEEGRAR